jgi:hypothetical protein
MSGALRAIGGLGLIAGAVSRLLDMLRSKQIKQAGRDEQALHQQQESLDTAKRVQQAEAGPHGRDVTQDRLDKGTF